MNVAEGLRTFRRMSEPSSLNSWAKKARLSLELLIPGRPSWGGRGVIKVPWSLHCLLFASEHFAFSLCLARLKWGSQLWCGNSSSLGLSQIPGPVLKSVASSWLRDVPPDPLLSGKRSSEGSGSWSLSQLLGNCSSKRHRGSFFGAKWAAFKSRHCHWLVNCVALNEKQDFSEPQLSHL